MREKSGSGQSQGNESICFIHFPKLARLFVYSDAAEAREIFLLKHFGKFYILKRFSYRPFDKTAFGPALGA